MKSRTLGLFLLTVCVSQIAPHRLSAAPRADLVSPQKRQAVVRVANQLIRETGMSTAFDVRNPFSPPEFDISREESISRKLGDHPENSSIASKSDREILESLASRFPATGTITRGDKILLTAGRKQFEAGQLLTLSEVGREYEVQIVAISATTFTLRFRNEEFTRPVRLSK
jgi:hypothetical protein